MMPATVEQYLFFGVSSVKFQQVNALRLMSVWIKYLSG